MAYLVNNDILDTHYNDFVNNGANAVNLVWGVGTGDKGYGQSTTLGTVSDGQDITATQWSTFIQRMNSAAAHQGSSITSQTLPVIGNTVDILANLETDLATITSNRLNNVALGTSTGDLNGVNGTGSASWTVETKHSFSITFEGGDEVRHFFNAGGEINIAPTYTPGGTPNAKEVEWVDLLETKLLSVTFAGDTTIRAGVGTISSSVQGYYNLTANVNQTILKMFADTAPYTTNFFRVDLNPGAVHGDGRGNLGNVLRFDVICRDDAAEDDEDLGTPGSQITLDTMDGTILFTITVKEPSLTNLNNLSWGTIVGADLGISQA